MKNNGNAKKAQDHAEVMLCMARAGKLTIEDMDTIMGFASEEEKFAAHDAFYALLKEHPYFDSMMILADRRQHLISQYDEGLVVTAEMLGLENHTKALDIISFLRHINITWEEKNSKQC